MIRDTEEQPDEELYGVKSGRIPSTGTFFCFSGAGSIAFLVHGCVRQPGSCPTPHYWDVYGGFLKQAQSIIISGSSPLSLCGMGSGDEISNFSLSSPHPEVHPELPCQNQRHSYYPGNYRVSGALCQELGSKIKYQNKSCFQCLYHLGNYGSFKELRPGAGDEHRNIFLITLQYHNEYVFIYFLIINIFMSLPP